MSYMVPAYATRGVIAAARYGPTVYRAGKRALSAGAFAKGMYDQFRGRKRAKGKSPMSPPATPAKVVGGVRSASKKWVSKAPRGHMGRYQGKLKKPKGSTRKQSMIKYSSRGAVTVQETTGTVADPDSVYLYAHVLPPEHVMLAICKSIARKCAENAFKVKYTSLDNLVLQGNYSPTLGEYYQVVSYVNQVTGGITTVVQIITAVSTINTVAADLTTALYAYSAGFGLNNTSNAVEPFTITVYKRLSSNTDSLMLYTMNLRDEVMDLVSSLELKVQNRSLSAAGSSGTDVVDSNPLQGFHYHFTGIPKSRDQVGLQSGSTTATIRAAKFGSIQALDGINLIRGAELPQGYKEPVFSKTFYNCKGISKIRLEPGAIKRANMIYKKKMNVMQFIQKFQYLRDDNTATARVVRTVGGGILLAFEDVINVNSTSNISVTYEKEHRVGCTLSTRKKGCIVPDFIQNTYNNVPA